MADYKDNEIILNVQHLQKAYGEHQVLKDISFEVHKGKVMTVIGPSGGGKSTMLRCINLLEDPTGGEILFHDQNILDENYNIPRYRSKVGMVFQQFELFENKNVLQNCMIGQELVLKRSKAEAKKIALENLKTVGMDPYVDAKPRQLSGGQKQRVAIARAISMNPEILLFDEPTSALDPISTLKIEDLATELKEKYTIVIVTHNMQQAARISDKTAFFLLGELLEYDETEKIFRDPKNKKTEDYITGRFG